MDITTNLYLPYLQLLTKDLFFMSESDYPWEVVYLGKDEAEMKRLLPFDLQAAKQVELTQLLKNALKTQDWYGEEELAIVKKYQYLLDTLQTELQTVYAYKFGEIEIAVYVLVHLPNNEWIALKTISVET